MDTFLEGVEATRQPCTLALLIPALALTLIARSRALSAVIGYTIGASLLAWAQAARYWDLRGEAPSIVIAGLIAGAAAVAVADPRWLRSDLVVGGAVVAGAIGGWLWRPCVGPRLADILNDADTDAVSTLLGMSIYVTGALLPVVVLSLIPVAVPRLVRWRDSLAVRTVSMSLALLWAGAIAVGVYDDLVAELLRRSTA